MPYRRMAWLIKFRKLEHQIGIKWKAMLLIRMRMIRLRVLMSTGVIHHFSCIVISYAERSKENNTDMRGIVGYAIVSKAKINA